MADTATGNIYLRGIITVTGANGKVTVGAGWADSDLTGVQLTHRANVLRQKNGLGNTRGAVALDEQDTVMITFYPLPEFTGSPAVATAEGYRALDLPASMSLVTLVENTLPSGSGAASGVLLNRLAHTFLYMEGGSFGQAPEGLLVFNLPCVRFGPAFGALAV